MAWRCCDWKATMLPRDLTLFEQHCWTMLHNGWFGGQTSETVLDIVGPTCCARLAWVVGLHRVKRSLDKKKRVFSLKNWKITTPFTSFLLVRGIFRLCQVQKQIIMRTLAIALHRGYSVPTLHLGKRSKTKMRMNVFTMNGEILS